MSASVCTCNYIYGPVSRLSGVTGGGGGGGGGGGDVRTRVHMSIHQCTLYFDVDLAPSPQSEGLGTRLT